MAWHIFWIISVPNLYIKAKFCFFWSSHRSNSVSKICKYHWTNGYRLYWKSELQILDDPVMQILEFSEDYINFGNSMGHEQKPLEYNYQPVWKTKGIGLVENISPSIHLN